MQRRFLPGVRCDNGFLLILFRLPLVRRRRQVLLPRGRRAFSLFFFFFILLFATTLSFTLKFNVERDAVRLLFPPRVRLSAHHPAN